MKRSNYGRLLGVISFLSIQNSLFAGGNVTTLDEASLRAALVGGGTVTFGTSGTITVTNTLVITNNTTIYGSGQTVAISGSGCRVLWVNGGVSLTLIHLTVQNGFSDQGGGLYNNGGNVVISNCVFQGNTAQGNTAFGAPGSGGGIYNNGGTIVMSNCTFIGNAAYGFAPTGLNERAAGDAYGGGIYTTNGSLNGWNCYFTNNTATGGYDTYGNSPTYHRTIKYRGITYGGAIFSDSSSVTLSSGAIVAGSADGAPAAGGGIYQTNGTLTLSNLMVLGNAAHSDQATVYYSSDGPSGQGGGVCGVNAIATLTDCQLIGNSVSGGSPVYDKMGSSTQTGGSGSGGGIYCAGTLALNRCTVASNTVAGGVAFDSGPACKGGNVYGAGVFGQNNQLNLVNCTVVGNVGQGGDGNWHVIPGAEGAAYGGGVYSAASQTTLTNCTLATNGSFSGNAFWNSSIFNPGPPTRGPSYGGNLAGTGGIQLINTIVSGGISNNAYGALTDLGHNLSSDASCNFTNTGSLNNTDPKLGQLANNGGSTPTMALMPDSPAIDVGVTLSGIVEDQRGITRPYGSAPDIGAYEWNATSFYPLQISQLVRTNGHWAVLANGPGSATFRLQQSSNLMNWFDVLTNSSSTYGSATMEDADASAPIRFYRIISP